MDLENRYEHVLFHSDLVVALENDTNHMKHICETILDILQKLEGHEGD